MKHDADLRIIELGLILPPAPKPVGLYKPVSGRRQISIYFGQGPIKSDGTLMLGRLVRI